MKLKTLLAVAVAGAFALPLAAQASADGDRMILAQAGGPAGASSTGTGPTGGTPSPRTAGEPKAPTGGAAAGATTTRYHRLDTNHDGYVSREEAAAASGLSFSDYDKNNDGRLSADELRSWRDPMGANPGEAGAGGTTGTTAGPGDASPRTAPSSDTATSPSTSGTGKAQ
jgi:hypothetical protein